VVLSALEYRRRTGKGLYVDFSQYEAGVCAVAESIMDFTMNGRVQTRRGNRHGSMAPHGCYRCAGDDRWVAIAVASDAQWSALCRAMGNPPWTADERFSDQLNRWLNQDELDPLIEQWTRTRDCYEVMHTIQAAGGAAGAVLDNRDFPLDPHVKVRDFFWIATRPETGTRPCYGSWQKMSRTPPTLRRASPTLGEHNEEILTELLGLSKREIDDLASEKIITKAPLSLEEGPPPAWVVVPPSVMLQLGMIAAYDENYKAILGLPEDEITDAPTPGS
jgi:benzylsuccinate CoA-transferase BbsF subunit